MLRVWYQDRLVPRRRLEAQVRRTVRLDRPGTSLDDGYHLRRLRPHSVPRRARRGQDGQAAVGPS